MDNHCPANGPCPTVNLRGCLASGCGFSALHHGWALHNIRPLPHGQPWRTPCLRLQMVGPALYMTTALLMAPAPWSASEDTATMDGCKLQQFTSAKHWFRTRWVFFKVLYVRLTLLPYLYQIWRELKWENSFSLWHYSSPNYITTFKKNWV